MAWAITEGFGTIAWGVVGLGRGLAQGDRPSAVSGLSRNVAVVPPPPHISATAVELPSV